MIRSVVMISTCLSWLMLSLNASANTNAEKNRKLWQLIETDTFPFLHMYEYERQMAAVGLQELSQHPEPHSEDYDNVLRSVLVYNALAGNKPVVDSLIQVKAKIGSPRTNELKAYQLLIDWLPCFDYQEDPQCVEQTRKLRDFLRSNAINGDESEAMRWHWISRMVGDTVLIDHTKHGFAYTEELDPALNEPDWDGAVLALERKKGVQAVLISNSYRKPLKLLEKDKKGKWTDVTKAALLDSIPGGDRLYTVDYNNDGYDDILVLRTGARNNPVQLRPTLLKNLGNGQYEDVTGLSGMDYPQRSVCACWLDVNQDGKLDLFLGNEGFNSLLFVQDSTGSFKEQASVYGIATRPYRIVDCAAVDMNQDGHTDLYLSVFNDANRTYTYRELEGGYPFFIDESVARNSFTPYKSSYILTGDHNADQHIDIIVNTDYSSLDRDVHYRVLSGIDGPEEFPMLYNYETERVMTDQPQYPILSIARAWVHLDQGGARPYVFLGGGTNIDEVFPAVMYQFLDDHYYYQMLKLKHQPLYINSMTMTVNNKTLQPKIWIKGGGSYSALKEKIAVYDVPELAGRYIRIRLQGKVLKSAYGAVITVHTISREGKKISRTRMIQVPDSKGNGAGQDIWFIPEGSTIESVDVRWSPDKTRQYSLSGKPAQWLLTEDEAARQIK